MAVSRAMRRLLRVREMEAEQSRAAVESALSGLKRLQRGLETAQERERRGRGLVTAGAATGELVDRIAGLEETRSAQRQASALAITVTEAEQYVQYRLQEFLAKRIERRQVEALVESIEKDTATAAGRRAQREMDDWFLSRARRSGVEHKERWDTPTPR